MTKNQVNAIVAEAVEHPHRKGLAMNATTKTAAGEICVLKSAKSTIRNTTVFLGTLPDGRFVVSSRFQWEVRTSDRTKAEKVFASICGE